MSTCNQPVGLANTGISADYAQKSPAPIPDDGRLHQRDPDMSLPVKRIRHNAQFASPGGHNPHTTKAEEAVSRLYQGSGRTGGVVTDESVEFQK